LKNLGAVIADSPRDVRPPRGWKLFEESDAEEHPLHLVQPKEPGASAEHAPALAEATPKAGRQKPKPKEPKPKLKARRPEVEPESLPEPQSALRTFITPDQLASVLGADLLETALFHPEPFIEIRIDQALREAKFEPGEWALRITGLGPRVRSFMEGLDVSELYLAPNQPMLARVRTSDGAVLGPVLSAEEFVDVERVVSALAAQDRDFVGSAMLVWVPAQEKQAVRWLQGDAALQGMLSQSLATGKHVLVTAPPFVDARSALETVLGTWREEAGLAVSTTCPILGDPKVFGFGGDPEAALNLGLPIVLFDPLDPDDLSLISRFVSLGAPPTVFWVQGGSARDIFHRLPIGARASLGGVLSLMRGFVGDVYEVTMEHEEPTLVVAHVAKPVEAEEAPAQAEPVTAAGTPEEPPEVVFEMDDEP